MDYTENALNILTAKAYRGIGRAWIVKNISGGEDVNTIVSRLNDSFRGKEKITSSEFLERRNNYEKLLHCRMKPYCSGIVPRGDVLFPMLHGKANNSETPVFLYYAGDISLLRESSKSVAVIGVLNPSESIKKRERIIVRQLVQDGAIIVSGLANGCDTIAHSETLKAGGKTVAILPSPLSHILPEVNEPLAKQIIEKGGLLLSAYGNEPSTQNERIGRYAERDKLQALFSNAVVLIASYAKDSAVRSGSHFKGEKLDSGSRFAMEAAQKYGIPRYVMYDASVDASDPMFDLNRAFLENDTAVRILSEEDKVSIRHIGE